jgi:hypothetical protein
MDNADLRALLLGAMKTAYEAGHHATVEGHYHEEWPDDHVDDWMDDEGIKDPDYARVPVCRHCLPIVGEELAKRCAATKEIAV